MAPHLPTHDSEEPQNPAFNEDESVVYLFDWISEGIGEQALRREAERASKRQDDPDVARAAFRFLHPNFDRVLEECDAAWEAAVKEVFAAKAETKNYGDRPVNSEFGLSVAGAVKRPEGGHLYGKHGHVTVIRNSLERRQGSR